MGAEAVVLKADFHMHTRYSPDSEVAPEKLVARCREGRPELHRGNRPQHDRGGFPGARPGPVHRHHRRGGRHIGGGADRTLSSGDHSRGLSPVETARRIKDQGGLLSLPHPFDRFRGEVITRSGLEDVLPYADIVEVFNSRNNMNADNRRRSCSPKSTGC